MTNNRECIILLFHLIIPFIFLITIDTNLTFEITVTNEIVLSVISVVPIVHHIGERLLSSSPTHTNI